MTRSKFLSGETNLDMFRLIDLALRLAFPMMICTILSSIFWTIPNRSMFSMTRLYPIVFEPFSMPISCRLHPPVVLWYQKRDDSVHTHTIELNWWLWVFWHRMEPSKHWTMPWKPFVQINQRLVNENQVEKWSFKHYVNYFRRFIRSGDVCWFSASTFSGRLLSIDTWFLSQLYFHQSSRQILLVRQDYSIITTLDYINT